MFPVVHSWIGGIPNAAVVRMLSVQVLARYLLLKWRSIVLKLFFDQIGGAVRKKNDIGVLCAACVRHSLLVEGSPSLRVFVFDSVEGKPKTRPPLESRALTRDTWHQGLEAARIKHI